MAYYYYYYYNIHLTAFFKDSLGMPAPLMDFNEARDDGLAVASAGPYANHLHLAAGPAGYIIDSEREIVQQLCAKQYVAR